MDTATPANSHNAFFLALIFRHPFLRNIPTHISGVVCPIQRSIAIRPVAGKSTGVSRVFQWGGTCD